MPELNLDAKLIKEQDIVSSNGNFGGGSANSDILKEIKKQELPKCSCGGNC